jgi:hypothetical protein
MEGQSVVFETLNEAIIHAFRIEQTSLLSLDQICTVLSMPHLFIKSRSDPPVPCSTVTRRRISSTLSSSDIFIRAGPPRTCLWALGPTYASFASDGAVATSIQHLLTTYGPSTLAQLIEYSDFGRSEAIAYERHLAEHPDLYSHDPDGTFWFLNQKRPTKMDFESVAQALLFAFSSFPEGATVEQLHCLLCLSTIGGAKVITRRCVSRELSRRTDLFQHLSRAKYHLQTSPDVPRPASCPVPRQPPFPVLPALMPIDPAFPQMHPIPALQPPRPMGADEDGFSPFAFFNTEFQFSYQ